MSQSESLDIKTIDVEPVDEGVRVKPKRQLTEVQLANLKKGREKLAEIRKANKEQKEGEGEAEGEGEGEGEGKSEGEDKKDKEIQVQKHTESETQTESDLDQEEPPEYVQCSIM